MKITRLGRSRPLVNITAGTTGTDTGASGSVITSTGSNGETYWGPNVATITSNSSNTLTGPFVNFASGSGVSFAAASNTLTISATGASASSIALADIETHHRFLVTAHRGDIGSDDGYPENTIEGIRQAAIKGADRIELDVKQSTDGTWWLMHDEDVARTTDGSGNLSAKSDAQVAALSIDGGVGYDAARHGTTLDVPQLSAVLTALEPYDVVVYFHAIYLTDQEHTDLATYIVAAGWTQRAIVLVHTLTGAAAVKAVSANLQTSALTFTTSSPQTEANVDQWLAVPAEITALTDVTSRAPEQVAVVVPVEDIGDDETAAMTSAYGFGVRDFMTNDLDAALDIRAELAGVGSVQEAGRWEPVTNGSVASPEIVFEAGDVVMEWVP